MDLAPQPDGKSTPTPPAEAVEGPAPPAAGDTGPASSQPVRADVGVSEPAQMTPPARNASTPRTPTGVASHSPSSVDPLTGVAAPATPGRTNPAGSGTMTPGAPPPLPDEANRILEPPEEALEDLLALESAAKEVLRRGASSMTRSQVDASLDKLISLTEEVGKAYLRCHRSEVSEITQTCVGELRLALRMSRTNTPSTWKYPTCLALRDMWYLLSANETKGPLWSWYSQQTKPRPQSATERAERLAGREVTWGVHDWSEGLTHLLTSRGLTDAPECTFLCVLEWLSDHGAPTGRVKPVATSILRKETPDDHKAHMDAFPAQQTSGLATPSTAPMPATPPLLAVQPLDQEEAPAPVLATDHAPDAIATSDDDHIARDDPYMDEPVVPSIEPTPKKRKRSVAKDPKHKPAAAEKKRAKKDRRPEPTPECLLDLLKEEDDPALLPPPGEPTAPLSQEDQRKAAALLDLAKQWEPSASSRSTEQEVRYDGASGSRVTWLDVVKKYHEIYSMEEISNYWKVWCWKE